MQLYVGWLLLSLSRVVRIMATFIMMEFLREIAIVPENIATMMVISDVMRGGRNRLDTIKISRHMPNNSLVRNVINLQISMAMTGKHVQNYPLTNPSRPMATGHLCVI